MSTTPMVKIHPHLARATLRERHDRQYRLWLVLRALDTQGRGHPTIAESLAFIVSQHRLLSQRSFFRTLRAGQGRWWGLDEMHIHLRSLASVCGAFGVRPGRPIGVSLLEACKNLSTFRGFCLAAQFASEQSIDKPVALASLALSIGRCPRSVARYLEAAHVFSEPNVLESGLKPVRKSVALDEEGRAAGWYTWTVKGHEELRRRLPNSYYLDAPRLPMGRGRKVRIRVHTGHHGGRATRHVRFVAARSGSQEGRRAVSHLPEGQEVYLFWRPPVWRDGNGFRRWEGYGKKYGNLERL